MEEKKNKEKDPKSFDEPGAGLGAENRLLDRAFAVIREHIDRGHTFTYSQMDIGIEVSLPVLPKPEQELFKEIARTNNVSLWQVSWAQFRRSHEQGMAFTLFLDPGWKSGDLYGLAPAVCEECKKTFNPDRFGARYCSSKCGAEEERRRLGLPSIEEQLKDLEKSKSQEQRVAEEDRAMLDGSKVGPIDSPVV